MIRIGYLTMTPVSTGSPIVGPSIAPQAPDTVEIVDMEHTVRHEYDQQHGTPSGDRKHEPLKVIKEIDMTTPILNVMCCNAERFSEIKLEYFLQVGETREQVNFYTWTLQDAYINSIRSIPARELGPEFEEQYDLLEEISFVYQRITWEHHAHTHPVGVKELPNEVQSDSWGALPA